MRRYDRRAVCLAFTVLLAGCASQGLQSYAPSAARFGGYPPNYGPIVDDGHEIPGLDAATVDPDKLRRQVPFAGRFRPGTIVVDVEDRRLYLVEPGGMAMRYTVGVGREEALNFRGSAVVGRKAEWPRWTPTAWMMKAMPRYRAYAGGMAGGLDNPLGARALYLYRDGRDTFFRVHGTNEPETIGTAVSSGCIRMFNHDVIDLYARAPVGTPVVVLQEGLSDGPVAYGPDAGPGPEIMVDPGPYGAPYYAPFPDSGGYYRYSDGGSANGPRY